MIDKTLRRRTFLEKCIVRGLLVGAAAFSQTRLLAAWEEAQARAMKPTTPDDLGPFYKKGAPNKANLRVAREPGLPLRISGKILDTRGEPVHDARVELWHADQKGIYDLQGYRYRTKLALDSATDYQVETIMPGHYAARPVQHVHYLITAPGCKPLITQLYFATDPVFDGDPDKNFKRDPLITSRELVRPVMIKGDPKQIIAAVNFDLVMETL